MSEKNLAALAYALAAAIKPIKGQLNVPVRDEAFFNKKWQECQARMCTGCEFCNNCQHGTEINTCDVCSPTNIDKCKHGNNEDDCETCEDERMAQEDADAWEDAHCEHGVHSRDCWDCAAEDDALAQHAKDRDDFMHYHPAE